MKIKYSIGEIQFMSLFGTLTGARLKDCIIQDSAVLFIVQPNELGRAVGKGGANVRMMEKTMKRKVRIAEFSPDMLTFINNLVYPISLKDCHEEDGTVTITAPNLKARGLLIGRNATQLRAYEAIVKRHFPLKKIRVS